MNTDTLNKLSLVARRTVMLLDLFRRGGSFEEAMKIPGMTRQLIEYYEKKLDVKLSNLE